MDSGCILVLDIGKSIAKLSVWRGAEVLERRERPNLRIRPDTYLALDSVGIERWLKASLVELAGRHRIDTIVPVAHGAAAALIRDGALAAPPLDYEQPIPAATRTGYEKARDPFTATGSPPLPDGLNLGLQLAWLEAAFPKIFSSDTTILPWPQYWAFVLCGVAASEVTSLGCHTDLWNPQAGTYSRLATERGWAARFAPLRHAGEALGTPRAELLAGTGLHADTRVLCGIHDSNAALLAARSLLPAGAEFTVLSTGTWFIALRSPSAAHGVPVLDERRDCLLNVDAHARPTPSARFMGGRELELLLPKESGIDRPEDQTALIAAAARVIEKRSMALPTQTPGVGPFPWAQGGWQAPPQNGLERRAAAALYAALNSDAVLDLLGSTQRIIVEGRFAKATLLVRALAALRPDCEVLVSELSDAVALGALGLASPAFRPAATLRAVPPLPFDLRGYREAWRAALTPPVSGVA